MYWRRRGKKNIGISDTCFINSDGSCLDMLWTRHFWRSWLLTKIEHERQFERTAIGFQIRYYIQRYFSSKFLRISVSSAGCRSPLPTSSPIRPSSQPTCCLCRSTRRWFLWIGKRRKIWNRLARRWDFRYSAAAASNEKSDEFKRG